MAVSTQLTDNTPRPSRHRIYNHVKNTVGVALLGCVCAGAFLGATENADIYRGIGALVAVLIAARVKFL